MARELSDFWIMEMRWFWCDDPDKRPLIKFSHDEIRRLDQQARNEYERDKKTTFRHLKLVPYDLLPEDQRADEIAFNWLKETGIWKRRHGHEALVRNSRFMD